ncbi:MAG: thioredoxin [Candidatus Gastranaerophilales bacterium]|nr:thioredoxin [Candidatus Gastranaerophilales bacterium]
MNAILLNDSTFDSEVKNSSMPVLVDFYADWCGPCRKQLPVMEEMASAYAGKAKIAKMNVDESRDKAAEYGISSIPALLVFKNGEIVERLVGLHSKGQLDQILSKYI